MLYTKDPVLNEAFKDSVLEYIDTSIGFDNQLADAYRRMSYAELCAGHYEKALPYYRTYAERLESREARNLFSIPWMAYAYLKNGDTTKADYYMNEQIKLTNSWRERGISGWEGNYLRLAQVCAMKGERENAISNLKLFDQHGTTSVHAKFIRVFPMFDKLKDDPEFRQIVDHLEARYQAEHERVRRWLEAKQFSDIQ